MKHILLILMMLISINCFGQLVGNIYNDKFTTNTKVVMTQGNKVYRREVCNAKVTIVLDSLNTKYAINNLVAPSYHGLVIIDTATNGKLYFRVNNYRFNEDGQTILTVDYAHNSKKVVYDPFYKTVVIYQTNGELKGFGTSNY